MFRSDASANTTVPSKPAFSLGNFLGRSRKEELDPIIDARIEGLATNLEANLPKRSCFKN